MIRINGSETEAIIYTDKVDSIALEQLEVMANSRVYAGQKNPSNARCTRW